MEQNHDYNDNTDVSSKWNIETYYNYLVQKFGGDLIARDKTATMGR